MEGQVQPLVSVTVVFHLLPGQQRAFPNLLGAITGSVSCDPSLRVWDLYTGAAWYLCQGREPTQEGWAGQLRLVRNSIVLEDRASPLLEAGLHNGDVVHVLQPGQALPDHFTIVIKTLTGNTFPVWVHSRMLVEEVKQLVEAREGVPPDQQRFVYQGRQLEDLRQLADYDIQEGDVVHFILRLKSC
jgi:hypothetical protein